MGMHLDKVWDEAAGRLRVEEGGCGQWRQAVCWSTGGEERWVLDEVPAELSEQAYMWQMEEGLDGSSTGRIEWSCPGWKPGAEEEQLTAWHSLLERK